MKTYEKTIENIKNMAPALTNPEVRFSVRPFHGESWAADDEPITITATYKYGDARDLCDWLTNPAKVAGVESYGSTVFIKHPYDMRKVKKFFEKVIAWHKEASAHYAEGDNDLPAEVKNAWGGPRPGAGRKSVQGKKIARSIKFSDAEWVTVKEKAEAENLSASEYIRTKALEG